MLNWDNFKAKLDLIFVTDVIRIKEILQNTENNSLVEAVLVVVADANVSKELSDSDG